MAYEKTTWKPKDKITSAALNKIEDSLVALDAANTDNEATFECMTKTINTQSSDIGELKTGTDKVVAQIKEMQQTVAKLVKQVEELQWKNAEEIVVDSGNATVNKPEANVVISSSSTIPQNASVTAKAIRVKDVTVASARMALTGTDSVAMTGVTTSGDLPKSTSNAAWSVNTNGEVKIDKSTFGQTGYNCIEIGLTSTSPKKVTISDINFTSALTNNAILIFDTADEAVIDIKNCTFASVSNAIRLSNRSNVRCTLNITNCHVEKWDTNPTFAGMLMFEDYTGTTAEQNKTDNRYGPDKITVNITDCTYGSDRTKIAIPEGGSLADICGTNDAKTQIIYIYNDKEGAVAYSEDRYPVINIS